MSGASSAAGGSSRLWEIDALRGLMLVLMTLTHVPTRFSSPAGQPFGYVSAAEGFVLLSAFMAGWIYTARQLKDGVERMRLAFLKRVAKIYLSQTALLLFVFTAVSVVGVVAQQPAITNLLSFYLEHPVQAIAGSLLLVYNPPLLDILPMYILFMLASPLVLVVGGRRGWGAMMGASVALWLGAQFGLGRVLYDGVVATTEFVIPFAETGAFDILAWQMLWMIGLWMGAMHAAGRRPGPFPGWLVAAAALIGATGFVWRHAVGQAPFGGNAALDPLFDKWALGPLRILDLFALLILTMHFAPWLRGRLPRVRALEVLGAASLPVFCIHLVIALMALAIFGEASDTRSWFVDVAILAAAFAVLYAVALISGQIDRHSAAVRAAFAAKQAARAKARAGDAVSAGAPRSPTSRSRSPPR
ncbi:MAG: OpgC domain-containing protein [Myxococcales bacterium]|nr:OpgC domain-containing protein [Myxococcales bacterium]